MAAATPVLRPAASSNTALLVFGVLALAAVGALGGFGLALGGLEAFWICLAVIGSLAVLLDFRVGAVLLIVLLPIEASTLFPHALMGITGLNPVNLLLIATLASYVLRGRSGAAARFVPLPLIALYLTPLLIAALIGARHAGEILPTFYYSELIQFTEPLGYLRDMLLKPMTLVIAALLVAAAVAKSKKVDGFLVPIVVSIWVICLTAIGYVLAEGATLGALANPGAREFFTGIGMHANALGRLYAVAYALLLFTWGASPGRALQTLLIVTMALVTIALTLTFSRGAFLGFVLINVLFLIWRFNVKTLGLALLAALFIALFLPGAIHYRVTMGFETGDANVVSAGRIDEIWLPLVPDLLRTPPWGNGLGSVMWSDAMLSGLMLVVTHPHSAYIEALLDLGIIGAVLLCAYFVHVWRGFRALGSNAYLTPAMRGFFQGAAAGLLSFAVTGFFGSSLTPQPEYCYLWLAIGMMYGQFARKPAS